MQSNAAQWPTRPPIWLPYSLSDARSEERDFDYNLEHFFRQLRESFTCAYNEGMTCHVPTLLLFNTGINSGFQRVLVQKSGSNLKTENRKRRAPGRGKSLG